MAMDVQAPQGIFYGKTFVFPARVYYEDTDAGGVVYYANYLKYAERARTEFIRALGVNQQDALSEDRCGFMVRSLNIEYKAPAVLDDLLSVSCELSEMKGAGAEMKQEIYCGEKLLAKIEIKLAYVSLLKKRPVRIPETLLEKVEAL